jgi:hypothetical protein
MSSPKPSASDRSASSSPKADGSVTALRELVHRAKGGMNNAAISLELLESSFPMGTARTPDFGWLVTSALRGLAQAARSVHLLAAASALPLPVSDDSIRPSVADIAAVLSAACRRANVTFEHRGDEDGMEADTHEAERLASILAAGVHAIDRAGAGGRVCLRCSVESPAHLVYEVAPQAGSAFIVDPGKPGSAAVR